MRKRFLAIAAILAAYFLAYGATYSQRKPAGNMAYFVYSDGPSRDALCYRLFLPAYRVHQVLWRAFDRPFTRYNGDRPRPVFGAESL